MTLDLDRWRAVRRDLHAHPELAFEEHRTAAIMAAELTALGADVTTGVGVTGVVGVIHGRRVGPTVALRADMDALPLDESSKRDHASTIPGVAHACGHDGHCAMLLGAAELLAADRDFAGTVVLVCQPAEEGAAGAVAMLDDGLLDRFGIQEIYGLHNIPGMAAGDFAVRAGTQLASFDGIDAVLTAEGGHVMDAGAAGDVIAAGAALVTELQTVVPALQTATPAVVSITSFHAGTTDNVLPTRARLRGTARSLSPAVRERIEASVRAVCVAVGERYAVDVDLDYDQRYRCTVNDPVAAARAARCAQAVAGAERVDPDCAGILAAEDFSFFLERIPGAYVFIGNGTDSGPVHRPDYDFNDDIIEPGARFLDAVARAALADLQ